MAVKNLISPQNVKPGIGEILFVAPLFFFKKIKEPVPPFLYAGASVTIFDSHEFLPGYNFLQLALPANKNELTAKATGEQGSYTLEQDIKCIIAGSYAQQHELIKNLLNVPLIVLVKDAECAVGFMYQLGCDCAPAYLTTDFSTGTTKDGVKGYSATISARNAYLQLYGGNVVITPAVNAYIITEDGEGLMTEDDNLMTA